MNENFELLIPYSHDCFIYRNQEDEAFLSGIKSQVIKTEQFGLIKTSFELLQKEKKHIRVSGHFDIENNTENWKQTFPDISEPERYAWGEFSEDFLEGLYNFFAICNITLPACFSVNERPIFTPLSFVPPFELFPFRNTLDAALEVDEDFPPLYELTLEEAVSFFENVPGFYGGNSQTNVGHACMCFSHFFDDSYQWIFPSYFMWSMVGLEALYGRGNSGMMNQMIEKSAIFLNFDRRMEKVIKEMYNYRSRLFHGQTPLRNSILKTHNLNTTRTKYTDLEEESSRNATYIFILSLQKCIKEKIYDLNFSYIQNT